MKRFFAKKRRVVMVLIWVAILALRTAAWLCPPFCDWYVAHVLPIWLNTYGRLSGLFPFSIGEWMLYLAAVLVLIALVLWMIWLPFYIVRRRRRAVSKPDAAEAEICRADTGGQDTGGQDIGRQEKSGGAGKNRGTRKYGQAGGKSGSRFDRAVLRFYQAAAWIVTVVCLIMTLNCLIYYHCTPLQDKNEQYDLEELIALRERIVTNCNRLSECMQRDERGEIVYDGDMKERAIQAMHALSEREDMPRLAGYYSKPKPLYASWFFCQQHMCGYYFPFSLEANYNDMMYIMNFPYTMCHELSHLKGYLYEDEANYLAYLACVGSGDEVFEYSGYLNVLYYVESDLSDALMQRGEMDRYASLTPVKEQVHLDNVYVTSEQWERVNEQSPLNTQLVSDVTDSFLEANLTMNGVSDGVVSYSRVVGLLLSYYHEAG